MKVSPNGFLFIGVVLVAFVTTACGSDAPTVARPPTTTASSSPSPTTAGPASGALAAYRGMWDSFVEAGKTSDPDAPNIRRFASGQALRLIVSALVTNREQRKVIRGDLAIDPTVTAETPTEVTIVDCVNDEKWLVHKMSGGLEDDEPGGKHHTTATVKRTDEGWKVTSFILKDSGTC
jgi:hypothetical protein